MIHAAKFRVSRLRNRKERVRGQSAWETGTHRTCRRHHPWEPEVGWRVRVKRRAVERGSASPNGSASRHPAPLSSACPPALCTRLRTLRPGPQPAAALSTCARSQPWTPLTCTWNSVGLSQPPPPRVLDDHTGLLTVVALLPPTPVCTLNTTCANGHWGHSHRTHNVA